METIYWIQRLGTLNTIAMVFLELSIVALMVFSCIAIATYEYRNNDDSDGLWHRISIRGLKIAPCLFVITMLACIFVPSENDLYAIYGIGGTIDYIKSNDTAKQLPDKVINALDAWIDKQTEDNNKDK